MLVEDNMTDIDNQTKPQVAGEIPSHFPSKTSSLVYSGGRTRWIVSRTIARRARSRKRNQDGVFAIVGWVW